MVYYLSGPMTGIPDHNFPAFHEAAAKLRAQGLAVVSPAELDLADPKPTVGETYPWDYYLRRDLRELTRCDAVAVLPGWTRSKGAQLEVHVAKELGMPIVDVLTMQPVRVREDR
jgi:hypothetical protein